MRERDGGFALAEATGGSRPARLARALTGVKRNLAARGRGPTLHEVAHRPEAVALAGGLVFAALAAAAMLWTWGGTPQPDVFTNPDETTNRLAAMLVAESGSPVLGQPFEDLEDLVHVRNWYSVDGQAKSAYPPLTYYVYGFGMRAGGGGEWLPVLVAAAGVGAVAAAGALTLARRPLLGVLLPLIAFPFTFWVMRPWHSSGLAYALLALATLAFTLWVRDRRPRYLLATTAFVAFAGATRPDQLLYMFGALYLGALAIDLGTWRRVTVTLMIGGAASLALIALFNWAVVGHPLEAGYQELAKQPFAGSVARDRFPTPLQELTYAIAPVGIPFSGQFAIHLVKNGLLLGPVALLTSAALFGCVRMLRTHRQPLLLLLLIGLVALFVATRYCPNCFGADQAVANLGFSNPRYIASVYLLAGFAVLALLASPLRRWPHRAAVGTTLALAFAAAFVLTAHVWVEREVRGDLADDARIASSTLTAGTVVYARSGDLNLWSQPGLVSAHLPPEFPVDPEASPPSSIPPAAFDRLAASMARAYSWGNPVAVMGIHPDHAAILESHLSPDGLRLARSHTLDFTWLVEAERAVAR